MTRPEERYYLANRRDRARDQSGTGAFRGRCTVCEEVRECEYHHTSYRPPEKIAVCRRCHWRIHNDAGFHDELRPRDGYDEHGWKIPNDEPEREQFT